MSTITERRVIGASLDRRDGRRITNLLKIHATGWSPATA